jgi:hypothetical protein
MRPNAEVLLQDPFVHDGDLREWAQIVLGLKTAKEARSSL